MSPCNCYAQIEPNLSKTNVRGTDFASYLVRNEDKLEKRIQYFEKAQSRRQKDFIKNDGHCVLCSSPLEIKHDVEFQERKIREHAYCVECDVRARVKTYTLN